MDSRVKNRALDSGIEDSRSDSEPRERDAPSVVETTIGRVQGRALQTKQDNLAVEEPLEIQLGYGDAGSRQVKSISITMRTPGHDFELAAGFLMTERVVGDANDIDHVWRVAGSGSEEPHNTKASAIPPESSGQTALPYSSLRNTVRVELVPGVEVSLSTLERNFYTTSSCGVCGKASLLALQVVCPARKKNTFTIESAVLQTLPGRMREAQGVFDRTGGLHAAGLFDAAGRLYAIREDVGRHNAVDKLFGSEFLADRIPLQDRLLLLSGRASFELLQKALMAGIPMVAAVGAPSSLAVQVARQFDIVLVGFLREGGFNIYHGLEHIHASQANDGGDATGSE
jgi:FdhD protein